MEKITLTITIISCIFALIVTLVSCTWVISRRFGATEKEIVRLTEALASLGRRLERVELKIENLH